MHSTITAINDTEFLTMFENQTLDPVYFDHIGQMRMAWIYLHRYDLEVAIEAIGKGIASYAASLGASTKYHVTLADSIMRVMASCIRDSRVNIKGLYRWSVRHKTTILSLHPVTD